MNSWTREARSREWRLPPPGEILVPLTLVVTHEIWWGTLDGSLSVSRNDPLQPPHVAHSSMCCDPFVHVGSNVHMARSPIFAA